MHRNALRLLGLINQLMDLSKLDAGSLKLELSEGDLVKELKSQITSFIPLAEREKIGFRHVLPEKPVHSLYDADKLEKILSNLLSDAFKFTPENGNIDCKIVLKGKFRKPKSHTK